MSLSGVCVLAPAKVNLHLAIGPLRADGYHDVTTVLQSVTLYDNVTLSPAESLSLQCDPELGVCPEDNLVWRAATAFAKAVSRDPDVSIRLEKHIPAGAGLGGGSSDAAAVILGLAHLWDIDAGAPAISEVAASIGSDVPFFLQGGAALYAGRGDILVSSLPFVDMHVVVVKVAPSVSTAEAYAAFDRVSESDSHDVDATVAACHSGRPELVASALFNNMTKSSVGLVPGIGEALGFMQRAEGVLGAAMAGSGSAVFGICRDAHSADRIAQQARNLGMWAASARTSQDGVVLCEG